MSQLTLTVLQLGFLALLWLFVISVIGVLRRDLYGTKVVQRPPGRPAPRPRQAVPAKTRDSGRAPRQLVVTEGSLKGTSIQLSQAPVLVGRAAQCTLVLDDDFASSRHLRLYPEDGRWFAEDLGSTNGTYLGRERINGSIPVEVGAQLRIGRTVLELRK